MKTLEEILAAVEKLPPEERQRLKEHLAQEKNQQSKWGDEWLALLNSALDDFWVDTTPEEKAAILEALKLIS